MNYIKEKLNNIYIPLDSGKLGLFFSILAISFVISSSNSPCLQAQSTCAIGSDNEFTGNISLKGGTANKGTFDASGLTSDRTWTLPDATGTLAVVGATLPASKVMATDVSGNESTTDVYPLSLTSSSPLKTDALGNVTASDLDPETDLTVGTGIAAQVLSVNSGATALEFTSITGVPTLTADKFVITDGAGALTTTSLIPLSFGTNKPIVSDGAGNLTDVTLTADTPMKTDGNGNTSASDLDITTDITPGSALQEIRVNSGGTALEYFTPSSGGDYSLLDSGAITNPTGSADEFLICWGSILDYTKSYKLVMWGGTGNNGNNSSYYPYLRPGKNDCSSGTRTEWDSGNNANYGSSFVGRILDSATSRSQDVTLCPLTQGTSNNSSSTYISNVGGQINFMTNAWKYSDTSGAFQSNNKGIRIFGDMLGHVTQTSEPDPYNGGIQRGDIYCEWFNDLDFVDITHFYGSLAVDSASQQQVYGKYWALYESASQ